MFFNVRETKGLTESEVRQLFENKQYEKLKNQVEDSNFF